MIQNKRGSDGIVRKKDRIMSFDLPLARYVQKNKNSSFLFSSKGKTSVFYTSDSRLYFTQNNLEKVRKGEVLWSTKNKMDSASSRYYDSIRLAPSSSQFTYSRKDYYVYEDIRERYWNFSDYVKDFFSNSVQGVTAVRMWNLSIVSSLIFGMFLMTMIYRYLGQGASAVGKVTINNPANTEVLGEEDERKEKEIEDQIAQQILEEHAKIRAEAEKNTFEGKIKEMTKGYPIEKMAPDIARQDKIVAAFLIGIAKKESDWGKHAPVLDGKDCKNYWGFRAQREKMGTGGHTCFDSNSDAVSSVAKRIKNIIEKEQIKTPEGMVTVWKCGYDCSWDSPSAVKKWVKDVDGYFEEVSDLKK